MTRKLLLLFLFGLLFSALGCCPDCPAAEQLVRDRAQLPDIEAVPWSIFIDDGSPTAKRVAGWIATDPVLSDLVNGQTRFCHRPANDPYYLQTLAPGLGPAPLFALETGDGGLIFVANGEKIPATAAQFCSDIRTTVRTWDRLGRPGTPKERAAVGFDPCPWCPSPNGRWPKPDMTVKPVDDLQQDKRTSSPWSLPSSAPWWAILGAACVGLGLGWLLHNR